MDKHHGHGAHEPEKEFSQNVDELRKEEVRSAHDVEKAQERKLQTIRDAQQEAAKIIEEAHHEADAERKKLVDAELKLIAIECQAILEKAEAEAEKLRKGKDVSKIAQKLVPLVLSQE